MIKHAAINRPKPVPLADEPAGGGGVLGNLMVVGFLTALLGLGIRGLVIDESRFSWGMYGRNLEYLAIAHWIYPDGRRITHRPGSELGGKSLLVAPRLNQTRMTHVTRHSLGTVRRWCQAYAKYLFEYRRPAGAERVVVDFQYAVEPKFSERHEFSNERISHPNDKDAIVPPS